jgi:hypothetical protein
VTNPANFIHFYCRLAENDIITRGVTVKMQQVAMRGNYEHSSNDPKGEDE